MPLGDWQAASSSSHRRVRIARCNFFSNHHRQHRRCTLRLAAECPQPVLETTSSKRQEMPIQPARQITQMPHACLIRHATAKLKGQGRTPNRLESAESQSDPFNA